MAAFPNSCVPEPEDVNGLSFVSLSQAPSFPAGNILVRQDARVGYSFSRYELIVAKR